MDVEDIRNSLSDSQEAARDYVESTAEYYKLRTFKFVMKAFIALVLVLFLGTFGLMALFFLSVAAAVAIGESTGDEMSGYMIVGGVYVVLGILAYVFRSKLEAPVLKNFSKHYVEE